MSFDLTTDGEVAVVEAVTPMLVRNIVPVIHALNERLDAVEQEAERLGVKS